MSPPKRPRIRVIEEADIADVLGIATKESEDKLRKIVRRQVDELFDGTLKRLRESYVSRDGVLTKTGIDNVSLRVESVHLLLRSFEAAIDDKLRFQRILFLSGLTVGRSFFDDFWAFLLAKCCIPRDYAVILSLWETYDSSAGFGSFKLLSARVEAPEIELSIQRSFLTRDLLGAETKTHPFCSFMSGYVQGVISSCLLILPRWLRQNRLLPPQPLKISSIRHDALDSDCRVTLALERERLEDACDKLYAAKQAFQDGRYMAAVLHARGAMESAVKLCIDLDPKDNTSFYKIVRELSRFVKERYSAAFAHARECYGVASNLIHRGGDPDRAVSDDIISSAAELLDILESHIGLRERDKAAILKNLGETGSAGPPDVAPVT